MTEQVKLPLEGLTEFSRKVEHRKLLADLSKRRAELEALKLKHRILTHRSRYSDLPWLAVQTEVGETRDIGTLMAEECRLLDEAGKTFEAKTEFAAVEGLIDQLRKGTK